MVNISDESEPSKKMFGFETRIKTQGVGKTKGCTKSFSTSRAENYLARLVNFCFQIEIFTIYTQKSALCGEMKPCCNM